MAHYKVSFCINGTTYYTEGESSYPSDHAINENDIDMDIAMDCAAVIASTYINMSRIEGKIEPDSLYYEIYKS